MSAAEDRVKAAVEELAEALLAVARTSPPTAEGPVALLSPAAFARQAGLGRSSVYLAIADGSVRSVKVRGRRLVPASELTRIANAATPARAVAVATKRPRRLVEELAVGAMEDRHHHGDRPPPR